jgi:hypothetical protein
MGCSEAGTYGDGVEGRAANDAQGTRDSSKGEPNRFSRGGAAARGIRRVSKGRSNPRQPRKPLFRELEKSASCEVEE